MQVFSVGTFPAKFFLFVARSPKEVTQHPQKSISALSFAGVQRIEKPIWSPITDGPELALSVSAHAAFRLSVTGDCDHSRNFALVCLYISPKKSSNYNTVL